MSFLYFFSIACFLFFCLILCFVILIQEGKGGGLGTSFGSGDSSDSLFGTSTPEILKKVTSWLAVIFVAFCLLLSFWTASLARHKINAFSTEQQEEIQQ